MKSMKKAISLLLVVLIVGSFCVNASAFNWNCPYCNGTEFGEFCTKCGVLELCADCGKCEECDKNNNTTYDEVTKDELGKHKVTVTVTKGSSYNVTIPKTIVLDGATGEGTYAVAVTGDIDGDKQITVIPYKDEDTPLDKENKLALSQAGKNDIYATVEQEKTVWTHDNMASTTGTIKASGLTAGSWSGSFMMNIAYENLEVNMFTTLSAKTWNGLSEFYGQCIWTDGNNIYYSSEDEQYVLNGDTWEVKTWNDAPSFSGQSVWTDGTNYYYSFRNDQYILNDNTWEVKTWNGLTRFLGECVWTDGNNIYYSEEDTQYVLNGDTWEVKTWNGLTSFNGYELWTDGNNIYYSEEDTQYVLNGDTWEVKTWNGLTEFYGSAVWTDGNNIYYSEEDNHYILNGDTWEVKTWNDATSFIGYDVWTDGTNYYCSFETNHYVFS